MKIIKKTLLFIVGSLIIIISALVIKTINFSSKQLKNVVKADEIIVDENKINENLSKAIQFQTISNPDTAKINGKEFLALHDYFEKTYPKLHATLTKEVIGKYSLLYKWEGKRTDVQPVLLMAHFDVVPIESGTEEKWEHPPFAGHIADGYIWGRGTLDDKASVLGILEAVETLTTEEFQPDRTIYIAFGHDEEVGGINGAAKIAEYFQSSGIEFEYVLDEGGLVIDGMMPGVSAPTALVGIAEKGYLSCS